GREVGGGPEPDRWQPLFTTSLVGAEEVLGLFRTRQRHAQGYRVGVHDESLDAVPCGYDKASPDPGRPRWHRGPLQMMGWLVALAYNALGDFGASLAGDFAGSHVRALRRGFLGRPGGLVEKAQALVGPEGAVGGQGGLGPVVDAFNAAGHQLAWLDNRRVVVSLAPGARPRAGP